MKFFAHTVCCGAIVMALAAGCAKKSPDNVLAQVGKEVITTDDFKAELQRRQANRQPVPDRQALLEEMIARVAMVQRAKATGLENSYDVRHVFEDVLIAKLKESELQPKLDAAAVSPAEIQAVYEKEIARFTQPAKAHLAMIYLAADTRTDTNHLAELAARIAEARRLALALPVENKGFGQIALNFSEDQASRYRGGDAGWFSADMLADRWPKEVVAAGLALKENGAVSDVIQTPAGFYLVKKMDGRPPAVAPLAQVSGGLQRELVTEKRLQVEKNFQQALRAAAQVRTNSQLLGTLEYPTPAAPAVSVPPALPGSP